MQASIRTPCARSHSTTFTVPSTAGPFLVAGEQEGQRAAVRRLRSEKLLGGHHHRRERGLHVGGAAAVQPALAVRGHEGVAAPLLQRAGGHHVGVAGEGEQRRLGIAAAEGPDW